MDAIVLCAWIIGLLRSFRSGRRITPGLVLALGLAMLFTPLPGYLGLLSFAVLPLATAFLWIQIKYDSALAEARAANSPKWTE